MAKASTETTVAPKRAPRKRAVRRVVGSEDAPVRRRTRTVAPRETESSPVMVATTRKAPASLTPSAPKASRKKVLVALGSFVVVVGAASWIGFSDAGQIDVNARINNSNQEAADTANTEAGNDNSITVPVQNTPPAAISGIRPRTDGGGQPEPVPVEVTESTSTATSTEEVSTEDTTTVSDESGTTEPEEPEEVVDEPDPVLVQ